MECSERGYIMPNSENLNDFFAAIWNISDILRRMREWREELKESCKTIYEAFKSKVVLCVQGQECVV
jgi:hypothetical protein